MEAATGERCVAVMTDHSPASVADPFWPLVHGEERVAAARAAGPRGAARARAGGSTEVVRVERSTAHASTRCDALTAFLRRQLFIAEGGEKDVHFRAILPDRIVRRDGALDARRGPGGVAWAW